VHWGEEVKKEGNYTMQSREREAMYRPNSCCPQKGRALKNNRKRRNQRGRGLIQTVE